jgi:hypothetical protein
MDMRKTNTLTENITGTELKNHDLISKKKKKYSILGLSRLSDPTRHSTNARKIDSGLISIIGITDFFCVGI